MIRLIRFVFRWAFRLVLLLVLGAVALFVFAEREPVRLTSEFDPAAIGEDVDAYLEQEEAGVADLQEGVEKRVIWAGGANRKTDWSVVYVHGFSGSSEELRPVPDRVAAALGANLFYTRLAGHGRDGDAMGQPVAGDWMDDMAEALAVGRRIGERVLVIATSTGGTVAAAAALDPAQMQDVGGIAFVSPNFRIKAPAARLLTLPGAEYVLPVVLGRQRGFEPQNPEHAAYWTERYPSAALFPMAALVRRVQGLDFHAAEVPALFLFSDGDRVVDARETRKVAAEWGGPAILAPQQLRGTADPEQHVIAGDILSPGMTGVVSDQIANWAKGL